MLKAGEQRWWSTESYSSEIRPVIVEQETAEFITIKGSRRRTAKKSDFKCYFPTWAEAHTFLMDRATIAAQIARDKLARAEREMAALMAMKEPE